MITIGKPYITETANHTKLNSVISIDGEKHEIWYETEKDYGKYLCYEKADAFLVGILPLAMAFGHDIYVENCPISEKLYWQLTNMEIPALAKFSNYYKHISLKCSLSNEAFESYAVGTGFSAGVDSFYTLLKNINKETTAFNITHLTFFNVGACGSYGGQKAEERYIKRIALFEKDVKDFGLSFVKVNSNISDFIMMSYNFTHSFRSCSAVLALQKLFCKYYYSADYSLNEFSFDPYDSSFYDLMNTTCFSTESIDFCTTGAVENRIEKLQYISQHPQTYKILNVCNTHDENCRTCEKCIRTMAGLYSINKLDNYREVFDIDYFNIKLKKNMAFVLSKSKDGTVEALYYKQIVDSCKNNNVKIPFMSYIVAIPLSIKFKALATARKSKRLKKLWHKRQNKNAGIRFNDI